MPTILETILLLLGSIYKIVNHAELNKIDSYQSCAHKISHKNDYINLVPTRLESMGVSLPIWHRPTVHFSHGGERQNVREVPSDWSEQCCSPDTFLQSDCWGADNTPLDNFRVPHVGGKASRLQLGYASYTSCLQLGYPHTPPVN